MVLMVNRFLEQSNFKKYDLNSLPQFHVLGNLPLFTSLLFNSLNQKAEHYQQRMSKYHGATDAFQDILQKVDETFIQAQSYLSNLRNDVAGERSESKSELTVVPSPVQSERSCSPPRMSCMSASSSALRRQNIKKESYKVDNEAFLALNKKKAVIVTTFKSKHPILDSDVKNAQKRINEAFNDATSSSSNSSSSQMSI
ncbi:hypothetical protein L3Y34_018532 [Caenorhabditis briggsae]|uniref:Uncharacterized protein n=2 Tax=Caenorhabditis briggsae TaxID=6238 RepID=A0AAE9DKY8_CAEBR|nr:hypothetical protein L3Y34_018532 [Caenorhabditis briggsae]